MNKSFFGRCALILTILAVLAPAVPLKGMDASAGDAQPGSAWFSTTAIASVVLAPFAGFGYLCRKHYNELHEIERKFDLATVSASAREENFRFALWRSTEGNTSEALPWKDAVEVCEYHDDVVQQLMHDAQKCEDRVYVYNDAGLRIEPKSVDMLAIKKAIAREKRMLEAELAIVAKYTNVPDLIIQQLAPNDNTTLAPHELVLSCAQKLNDIEMVSKLTVSEQVNNASRLKAIVHCDGWLPTSWTFAPCYQKASRLYLKLFSAYARLCALDTVINKK